MPQLSLHQQGRGAAAPSTPSLSPSPHAAAPAQRVGAALPLPPQLPALTWLSHPRPGPRHGADAATDLWDSLMGKNENAPLVYGGEQDASSWPCQQDPKILLPLCSTEEQLNLLLGCSEFISPC